MTRDLVALIAESGAAGGDLVYIRSANGLISSLTARLSTAPDLLKLKVEALGMDEPLIVAGRPRTKRLLMLSSTRRHKSPRS